MRALLTVVVVVAVASIAVPLPAHAAFPGTGPDLVADGMFWKTGPVCPDPTHLKVVLRVTNLGNVDAGPLRVGLTHNFVHVAQRHFARLMASDTKSVSFIVPWDGSYTVSRGVVDTKDEVQETDESNNSIGDSVYC